MTQTTLEFAQIELNNIIPDPNQPRRYFNETQLKDLTESILQKGVIQPILVRPSGAGYMIVSGERRYRASREAGLVSIPAMVRELSDSEALEIQITENLQREDVKPMEEAIAFLSLIEDKGMTIDELSKRIGKSKSFIAHRLRLAALIPDFQEMLECGVINITDALHIARYDTVVQNDLIKSETTDYRGESFDWRKKDDFELDYKYYLRNNINLLKNAKFPLDSTPSCLDCPMNTANQILLFEEEDAKCMNPACFAEKEKMAYEVNLIAAASDPDTIVVSSNYNDTIYKHAKEIIKAANISVLNYNGWKRCDEPEHPGTLEQYLLEEQAETEEERQEAKEQYEEMLKEYKEEKEEFDEGVKKGNIKKAFDVVSGTFRNVVLTGNSSSEEQHDNDKSRLLANEMTEIIEKEEKARQKDRVDISIRVKKLLQNHIENDIDKTKTVTDLEQKVLLLQLVSNSYDVRDYVFGAYFGNTVEKRDFWEEEVHLTFWNKIPGYKVRNLLPHAIRLFMLGNDSGIFNRGDFLYNTNAAAVMELAQEYIPESVAEITQQVAAQAEKREAVYNARVAAIKSQIEQLGEEE